VGYALPTVMQGFQSAPHFSSEANQAPLPTTDAAGKFQSAPHFSSEANVKTGSGAAVGSKFQSAPHFSSEANRISPGE